MTLKEGIRTLQGSPAMIPGATREDLPGFFRELGYKRGAEIGVYKGEFTAQFCQAGLVMAAVDPWRAFEGQSRGQDVQGRQDFLYGHAQRVLEPYLQDGRCRIIRETSAAAVKLFQPGELDFVYIDGDHSFPAVAHDIYEWAKIVRKGGMVSGHDYYNTRLGARTYNHVGVVVDAYTRLANIDTWWTFGWRQPDNPENRRLNWMWFKTWSG